MQVEEVDLAGELFLTAYEHWQNLRGPDRPFPHHKDLDPVDIPQALLPHCELIEVLSDPLDFRYRLIGTAIYEISRSSYTGLTVRQIPTQAPPSRMFDFLELACTRGAPLCARLPYVGPDDLVETVRNLLLPLGDGAGDVSMFWSIVEIARRRVGAGPKTASAQPAAE